FEFTVQVQDTSGNVAAQGLSIAVVAPPEAPICLPPSVVTGSTNPLSVIATSNCSDPQLSSTSIDWGDDTAPSSGTTVSHTYAAAGTYTVTSTATNTSELSNSASTSVTVTVPISGPIPQGESAEQTVEVTSPEGVPSVQVTYQCVSATGPGGTQPLNFYQLS